MNFLVLSRSASQFYFYFFWGWGKNALFWPLKWHPFDLRISILSNQNKTSRWSLLTFFIELLWCLHVGLGLLTGHSCSGLGHQAKLYCVALLFHLLCFGPTNPHTTVGIFLDLVSQIHHSFLNLQVLNCKAITLWWINKILWQACILLIAIFLL